MLYPRDPSLDPQLVWKGKDEQDQADLAVPVVPIYIQIQAILWWTLPVALAPPPSLPSSGVGVGSAATPAASRSPWRGRA